MGNFRDIGFNPGDFLRSQGVKIERMNEREIVFKCPMCGDTRARAHLYLDSGVVVCYHCGEKHADMAAYISDWFYGSRSKESYIKALQVIKDFAGCDTSVKPTKTKKVLQPQPQPQKVETASDEKMDAVYRVFFFVLKAIQGLQLSEEALENFEKRGVPKEIAFQNGYQESYLSPADDKWFFSLTKEKQKKFLIESNGKMSLAIEKAKAERVISEMLKILDDDDLLKVPGFYKEAGKWKVVLYQGVFIPLRNFCGQIIGAQIATQIGKSSTGSTAKYISWSSAKYEGGISCGSRIHMALDRSQFAPEKFSKTILVTEGVLKSDCISYLYKKKYKKECLVLGISGVNNTKLLKPTLLKLQKLGFDKVVDVLDADKATNYNVLNADFQIKHVVENVGMTYCGLYWDIDTAKKKLDILISFIKKNKVPVNEITIAGETMSVPQKDDKVFKKLCYSTALVRSFLKSYPKISLSDDMKNIGQWRDETKGYDDYLLFKLNSFNNFKK